MRLTTNYNNNLLRHANEFLINYRFNKGLNNGQTTNLNACRNREKIIKNFFSPIEALSSKPVFTISTEKTTISLFYYRPNGAMNNNSINNLGELLSEIFNQPVKLEFVKLYYPHLNRKILAEYLRLNTKKNNFRRLKQLLFSKRPVKKDNLRNEVNPKLPSNVLGIKIEISGRLETERVRPRKTVSTVQVGPIRVNYKSTLVDFGSYTSKNAHGAFTVKVWIRQRVSP